MTDQKLYKILELTTEGWTLIDKKAQKLTKEQCDAELHQYLGDGYSPDRLRAAVDV
tara:strand:+ start:1070 stop:1237 length:168 start_codon:yes stop_codon:yes gene_type:complete